MSRIPVASTTITPGFPCAKRPYQSSTSSVTKPSSVARQGTMAGTHERESARTGPSWTGENHRDRAASSRVGQTARGSGCAGTISFTGGILAPGGDPATFERAGAFVRESPAA